MCLYYLDVFHECTSNQEAAVTRQISSYILNAAPFRRSYVIPMVFSLPGYNHLIKMKS